MDKYLPTGNEWVSLPKINEETAGIEDFTYLSMQHKGMIEVRGSQSTPLFSPFLEIDGQAVHLENMQWSRDSYWIPTLKARAGDLDFSMCILTPVGERGFAVKLSVSGSQEKKVHWGLKGCWDSSWHCVNEDKKLDGHVHCYESGWNHSIVFDFRCGVPMFAFAPMCSKDITSNFTLTGDVVHYSLSRQDALTPSQPVEMVFYWGLGFEEVAAATSAKEMLRRG